VDRNFGPPTRAGHFTFARSSASLPDRGRLNARKRQATPRKLAAQVVSRELRPRSTSRFGFGENAFRACSQPPPGAGPERHPPDIHDERYVYVLWHEASLAVSAYRIPLHVLASRHADGELMARICRHLGIGVIRGSTRMVREGRAVVCLFDVPIGDLRVLLDRRNRRRYEPFGIAIEKRYAFRAGARPVIYLPSREAESLLSPGERWRVVALELERDAPIDWSYEREWRLAGDLALPAGRAVALVENWRDADEIYDRFQGQPPCAGVIPLQELFGTS